MDLFTRKANDIVKRLNENVDGKVIYSSEENAEDPSMDPTFAQKSSVDPKTVKAIKTAQLIGGNPALASQQKKVQGQVTGILSNLTKRLANISSKLSQTT